MPRRGAGQVAVLSRLTVWFSLQAELPLAMRSLTGYNIRCPDPAVKDQLRDPEPCTRTGCRRMGPCEQPWAAGLVRIMNAQPPAASTPAPAAADKPRPKPLPVARRATFQRRHRFVLLSSVFLILIPFVLTVSYLYLVARDQYASTTGFTVRTEETSSASELIGGLGAFIGGTNTSGNHNVLNAFIQSQDIVRRVQQRFDILGHYSQNWPADPIYSVWPDASIEDLLWFWKRMVLVNYDTATGLMDVQVRAGTPEAAQAIAIAIVAESEVMINALNEQARRDSMSNAQSDVEAALERLRGAREALTSFRVRTQIVDPQADIQGRMGVINNLQQQLAQALVDHDLLLQTTADTDPRVRQAQRRIEVINDRIAEERRNFATQDVTVFDTDYPRLIAQFESLRVDQEYAEQTYRAALAAMDAARSNADRQNLYLATYIRPTLAERPEYPERLLSSTLTLGFLIMIWSVIVLIYYSLRDRG